MEMEDVITVNESSDARMLHTMVLGAGFEDSAGASSMQRGCGVSHITELRFGGVMYVWRMSPSSIAEMLGRHQHQCYAQRGPGKADIDPHRQRQTQKKVSALLSLSSLNAMDSLICLNFSVFLRIRRVVDRL